MPWEWTTLGLIGSATWLSAALSLAVVACVGSEPSITGASDAGGTKDSSSGVDSDAAVDSTSVDTNAPDSGTNPGTDSGTNPGMDSTVSNMDTGTASMDSTVPPSDAPAGAFGGTYDCTLNGHVTVLGSAMTLPLDGEMVVTQTGTAIAATITNEAGASCTMDFTDQGGGVADINAGQVCMLPVTMPIMTTVTLTFVSAAGNDAGPPGTATLSGTTLSASLPFNFSAAGITGPGILVGPCTKM